MDTFTVAIILIKDALIVHKLFGFVHLLGLPNHIRYEVLRRHGDPKTKHFDRLKEALDAWQSVNANASVETLQAILKDGGFNLAADMLNAIADLSTRRKPSNSKDRKQLNKFITPQPVVADEMEIVSPAIDNDRREMGLTPIEKNQTTLNSPEQIYKLKQFLGFGAYGIVFSADVGNAIIAIKLLNPSNAACQKTLRECEIMSRPENHHRNLVKGFGKSDEEVQNLRAQIEEVLKTDEAAQRNLDTPYFHFLISKIRESSGMISCVEMELCGPNLRTWLTDATVENPTPMDPEEPFRTAALISQDIITGLSFLHSRKVLHRDLKPENIYFSATTNVLETYRLPVKIGDFGQSRHVHTTQTMTQTDQVFSALYRAKEAKVRGLNAGSKLRYGENADWYSLGLILYEVFYLIPHSELEWAFDELVNGRTLRTHPLSSRWHGSRLLRAKEIILGLAQRQSEDRREMITKLTGCPDVAQYLNDE